MLGIIQVSQMHRFARGLKALSKKNILLPFHLWVIVAQDCRVATGCKGELGSKQSATKCKEDS